jgi:HAD superfamily hydrolase (TIGR01509 family)
MASLDDNNSALGVGAVVFDLDGVLVDSEPVWEEVRRAYVAAHGGQWRDEAQRRMMGMSTAEWSAYLSDQLGVGLPPARIASDVIDEMVARYRHGVPALPGAVAATERFSRRWQLAVASSSPRVLIDVVLGELGIADRFRVTVSTEEVERGKPAPDVYLAVADGLGLPPERCVAIEDSSNGLRSATFAGCVVVAVPRPAYPPDPDALDAAAIVVRSLDELSVDIVDAMAAP